MPMGMPQIVDRDDRQDEDDEAEDDQCESHERRIR